ncbi:hypothetical protein HMPREF0497_0431 [Lentilactobacillus buchneri ATCC 11577]|nr:hypothetical protein HMPREF0497_0431 [Lentilactobacillus buchneri ATCC 11577]
MLKNKLIRRPRKIKAILKINQQVRPISPEIVSQQITIPVITQQVLGKIVIQLKLAL